MGLHYCLKSKLEVWEKRWRIWSYINIIRTIESAAVFRTSNSGIFAVPLSYGGVQYLFWKSQRTKNWFLLSKQESYSTFKVWNLGWKSPHLWSAYLVTMLFFLIVAVLIVQKGSINNHWPWTHMNKDVKLSFLTIFETILANY